MSDETETDRDAYGMGEEPSAAISVLEPEDCWARLALAPIGRIAVVVAGSPEIFPVNHRVREGRIYFRTAPGTKLFALVIGRDVAFEVDGVGEGIAWSVIAKGTPRHVDHLDEGLEEFANIAWAPTPKPALIEIAVSEISGRSFPH